MIQYNDSDIRLSIFNLKDLSGQPPSKVMEELRLYSELAPLARLVQLSVHADWVPPYAPTPPNDVTPVSPWVGYAERFKVAFRLLAGPPDPVAWAALLSECDEDESWVYNRVLSRDLGIGESYSLVARVWGESTVYGEIQL